MLEAAIEAGAEDVVSTAEGHEISTSVEDFFAVRDALEARFGAPEEARLDWKPMTSVALDEEQGAKMIKLLDALDESDDVQNVTANFELSDALMAKLSA